MGVGFSYARTGGGTPILTFPPQGGKGKKGVGSRLWRPLHDYRNEFR